MGELGYRKSRVVYRFTWLVCVILFAMICVLAVTKLLPLGPYSSGIFPNLAEEIERRIAITAGVILAFAGFYPEILRKTLVRRLIIANGLGKPLRIDPNFSPFFVRLALFDLVATSGWILSSITDNPQKFLPFAIIAFMGLLWGFPFQARGWASA